MITDVQEVNSRPFAPLCGLGMKLEIRPPILQLLCAYVHTSIASPPLHCVIMTADLIIPTYSVQNHQPQQEAHLQRKE